MHINIYKLKFMFHDSDLLWPIGQLDIANLSVDILKTDGPIYGIPLSEGSIILEEDD